MAAAVLIVVRDALLGLAIGLALGWLALRPRNAKGRV